MTASTRSAYYFIATRDPDRRKKPFLLTHIGQILIARDPLLLVFDFSSRLSCRIANLDNDVVEDYIADHGESKIALGTAERSAAIGFVVAVDILEGLPD